MSKARKAMVVGGLLLVAIALAALLLLRHPATARREATAAYADPQSCVRCHASAAAAYAKTGMAHAFYSPAAADTVSSPGKDRQYFHAASGTYYELTEHDGRFFQRRWQKGFDGANDNEEELAIDYVMGSGNHARTYLHREPDGTLIELPLAWYSEDGGHLAMNPGFDSAHPMTRRPIAYECMFCHNAYPAIPATAHRDLTANPVYTGALPEGIDCQRCHGPGAAHVQAAETRGIALEQVRAKILNPAHLSSERKMEVCEQCHLQTTSRLLPDRIRHYDQEPFGYDATKPLASFISYFSRDPAKGKTDNFEIVNGAYRLRQSQCFLKSGGALTCETCHNPHDLHKGAESAAYYANICMKCHAAALPAKIAAKQHPAGNDCVSCHMPKRRTEDVVHAVMTDHLIQRNAAPERDRLAARQEIPDGGVHAYRGPVLRYLLGGEQPGTEDALYEATAQVMDSSDLASGLPALTRALSTQHPAQPNFYVELGDARRHASDEAGAVEAYREAITLDPQSSRAQRRLGVSLGSAGQSDEALRVLRAASAHEPQNALLWYEQAMIELRTGALPQATADLRKALERKPDFADAQNNLGSALALAGDTRGAEAAFRAALRIDPYDSGTRANLGRLLAGAGDWKQAAFQLERAVALDGTNVSARGDYAVVLLQLNRTAEAETQARAGTSGGAGSAPAHDLLGQILAQEGKMGPAREEFTAALGIDPGFGPAQLDLAQVLIAEGLSRAALPWLEKAQRSPAAGVAERARVLLQQMPPR